jgi:hypothetical protein
LIHTAKSLPGYADCAETTEPEALRFQADLLELREMIQNMQQKYLGYPVGRAKRCRHRRHHPGWGAHMRAALSQFVALLILAAMLYAAYWLGFLWMVG